MATIINCTPHAISFVDDAGKVIRVVEPSGILPRVSSTVTVVGDIDGIPRRGHDLRAGRWSA